MIGRFLLTIFINFPYMSVRTRIKLCAMINLDMITSSLPHPAGRTLDLGGMGGTSPVIPSLLVGSYRPSCITPLAFLFPTTFVPFASLVPCTLLTAFLADSFTSWSNLVKSLDPDKLNLVSAHIASFLVCYTLIKLGYCIGLQKSILQPSQSVPFLGFECDSRLQAFRLLPDKKQKFISLVEAILDSNQVSMTDLQRLAGKCMSMSMAVPGARLFTNEITLAISRASRSSRPLPLSVPLRLEIEHWLFLNSWSGFLPWRSERHHQFVMYTDASSNRWAGVLNPTAAPLYASDYRPVEILSSDIAVKEALGLSNALLSFDATIQDSRVDVYVDSSALFQAWNRQSARSHALSDALKSIFEVLMFTNCILGLFHVPSANNLADQPSRSLSLADSRLSVSC